MQWYSYQQLLISYSLPEDLLNMWRFSGFLISERQLAMISDLRSQNHHGLGLSSELAYFVPICTLCPSHESDTTEMQSNTIFVYFFQIGMSSTPSSAVTPWRQIRRMQCAVTHSVVSFSCSRVGDPKGPNLPSDTSRSKRGSYSKHAGIPFPKYDSPPTKFHQEMLLIINSFFINCVQGMG